MRLKETIIKVPIKKKKTRKSQGTNKDRISSLQSHSRVRLFATPRQVPTQIPFRVRGGGGLKGQKVASHASPALAPGANASPPVFLFSLGSCP